MMAIGMATTASTVIVRLDRTIQYAAADVFQLRCRRLLDTRWSLSSGGAMRRPLGGCDEERGYDEEENDRD
jgi:hypothetical protein